MTIHDETRPLLKAYARIQGFGDDWRVSGARAQRYRLIGQATPGGGCSRTQGAARMYASFTADHTGPMRSTADGPQSSARAPPQRARTSLRVLQWGCQNLSDFVA